MGFGGMPGSTVTANIQHGTGPGCDWKMVIVYPDTTITRTDHMDFSWFIPAVFDLGILQAEPNDPSFPAGFKTWSSFVDCGAPPTFESALCRMEWNTIRAISPPDPNSAR
jgi:hypothetical protein